ncbi:MAG: hypothetical protein JO213_14235 [Alphaproteobacteria bacterium]|nr:hypothetical protein [Alphaproteobacteria bacterium]MBV9153438.1 hypothetical protein [Alphaproteobacteria bacterium]MBV9586030.1 hypothetical protein [Alphaproteobacteria bacterium]
MLESLTKSDIIAVAGLGVAAAILSELLPNARPALRSAVKLGVDLFLESEGEAEAELIQSLVSATMHGIRDDLSKTHNEPERRDAVEARVENFKRQARVRARRWGGDQQDRHRRYRRHIARLETTLERKKQEPLPERDRRVLDYAFEALGAEA